MSTFILGSEYPVDGYGKRCNEEADDGEKYVKVVLGHYAGQPYTYVTKGHEVIGVENFERQTRILTMEEWLEIQKKNPFWRGNYETLRDE